MLYKTKYVLNTKCVAFVACTKRLTPLSACLMSELLALASDRSLHASLSLCQPTISRTRVMVRFGSANGEIPALKRYPVRKLPPTSTNMHDESIAEARVAHNIRIRVTW